MEERFGEKFYPATAKPLVIGKALRGADLERRLKEAEALITEHTKTSQD
jgi:hypothetical protein